VAFVDRFPRRIIDGFDNFSNGLAYGRPAVLNPQRYPEDLGKLILISDLIGNRVSVKR